MPKYCVIGAGAAGLAALRALLVAEADVDCYEKSERVGGHWNTDYDFLHTITSRRVTGFAEFPMREDQPLFPSRARMVEYFNDFADTFGLREHIQFGVGVHRIAPRGHRGCDGWTVTLTDGREVDYDGVLVGNGHLWDCKIPSVPGEFTGTQLHSGQYKNTEDITGSRVLVVGAGNSGCDLAVDAAQHGFETSIVMRSGHYFQPKTFFGQPRSELAFLTEFTAEEQDLLTRLLIRMSVGTHENYPGMPAPERRTLAENAPVVNNLLLYWIQHGRISITPGITRFDGKTVHFADGTSGEFDTILWATGFHVTLPFLDESHLTRRNGVPLRVGAGVVPVGLENLYFIGLSAPRGGQPPVYEIQSQIVLQLMELAESGVSHADVAAALAQAQQPDERIDIVRPEWLAQVEKTRAALDTLRARQGTTV